MSKKCKAESETKTLDSQKVLIMSSIGSISPEKGIMSVKEKYEKKLWEIKK